jgi:signal transduction histidine kinase/CheY-like chemotaxis protein/HAMP domain-containing protein/HPt (histidine-containing phosphotransfer) domain-containing protein
MRIVSFLEMTEKKRDFSGKYSIIDMEGVYQHWYLCSGRKRITMNNSIYSKIRAHMLVLGVITAAVFTILIAVGLFVTRHAMVSAGNRLGDSAATDARQMLIEQTEEELSRLAQSKAAINDEKLSATAEHIRTISQIATNIKSNPAQYGYRDISFPDTANTEGRITVMVQIPDRNTSFNTLRSEIGLMANIQDVLLAIQTNNENVGTTYVGTEYGITVCADPDSAQKTPYFDPRTRVWYNRAKQANDLIWTDVFEDYLGRGLAITCAKPFYDADGMIAGVAGMGMFLVVLSEEVVGTKIGETGNAFMINEKGEMIISDSIKKDENGKIIRENILESDTFPRETALKMINGENGIEHVVMDGKEKLIAYHGLTTVPWSLAIIIDAEEVISPALVLEDNIISLKKLTLATFDGDIYWIAMLAGIILIFIAAGVLFFSKRTAMYITGPIQKLTQDAALIGAGDLEHVLETKTGDELEILADSFNSMIAGIKTITAENECLEITSAEKTREAQIIQEANQNLQTILNMLPVGIRIMSMEDGSLLFANKASLDVFNCTSVEQVLGHSGFEFMPEIQPDGGKTADMVLEFFRKESGTVEMQCLKLGGEPFVARINSITTSYKGNRASLAVIEDMTVEKEYQEKLRNIAMQEQEANQLKSRFLATMSHEIRTPMNVIIGITEIQLQKEENPPDTKDAFEKIYESGSLLLNIINDILDFSKIVEGKMEIVPFRYDIPGLINDTAQLNYLRCESKPIEFIVSVDPDTPLDLIGDELRVKQVLNNLLSNAFKYTDEGEIELSVSSEPAGDSPEDVIIVFRIRDTGQGISDEHIGRLFEDYMRFNRDKNRAITGTGLGLSITKRLLNLMNGEISVVTKLGKGSVFTVRLPQKRFGDAVCGAENVQRLREFDFHSTAIAKKMQVVREYMPYGSVLIVDDVKSNLFVARGLLSPYGLQIDAVDSGIDAVEKIKDGNVYDVIFMDHMMPVMDGIETAKIIRGTGYDRPIVALTANALVGQAEMFMQNGFDGFIPKPIDSRKLNAVLNDFIRDKKLPETVDAARRERFRKEIKGEEESTEKKIKLSELEKFFLIDARKAANELERMKINVLDEKDMESYGITVHGMKSALANIGETGLSETARRLEQAAIEKNAAVIHKETPAFIDALKSLIEKMIPVKDSGNAQVSGEDTAYLREKMLQVKTACETVNKKAAKAAMNNLKQKNWPRRINDVLDELSVHLLHSDFEKAAAIAEDAVKNGVD